MAEAKTTTGGRAAIFGAPLSWIAIFGAVLGATAIIPMIYYMEGGAVFPLATSLLPLTGLVLGPYAGAVAGLIGGIIGLFINPSAFSTGALGIIDSWILPPLAAGLIANKKWYALVPVWIILSAIWLTVPYSWPGPPAFPPADPNMWIGIAWMVGGGLFITVVLGYKFLNNWLRTEDPKRLFVAVFFVAWVAREIGHLMGWIWYDIYFSFPPSLNIWLGEFAVPWQATIFYVVSAIIGTAILRGLKRSGLKKIPRAVW